MRSRLILPLLVGGLLVASCGDEEEASSAGEESTTAGATTLHAVPADAVAVTGTATGRSDPAR
jgi:hypothetical protein